MLKRYIFTMKVSLLSIVVIALTALIACAPSASSQELDQIDTSQTTASIDWSPSTDCSVCHGEQSQSFADASLNAFMHAGEECVSCHSNEVELAKTHEGVSEPPTKPSRNAYTMANQATCIGQCHVSYEELADATRDSTALVDLNELVVNPHAVPASSGHMADSAECYNCHVIHTKQPADGQYCKDCHHTNYFGACEQCHT